MIRQKRYLGVRHGRLLDDGNSDRVPWGIARELTLPDALDLIQRIA